MKPFFLVALLVGASCFATSCDSNSIPNEGESKTDDRPDYGEASEPGKSRFLEELSKLDFPEADAPEESPVFRWDFLQKDAVHEYDYEQEVRGGMDMGAHQVPDGFGDISMSAKGAMVVRSQGDATAELVMKDVVMTMKQGGIGAQEQKVPAVAIQGMQEDGVGPFGNSSQDLFLKILFTLPAENMELGQTVEIPMMMPYQVMGSALVVKGQSKITLARCVSIGDRLCAQFKVETDISQLNVPPEIDGQISCFTTGSSILFFDVKQRCFVRGTICLLMEADNDLPMPNHGVPLDGSSEPPKRMKSSMVMDNLIKLSLKESP